MLGLGRASQYAGWWSGKPSFLSRSQVTGNQQTTWANAVSLAPNRWSDAPDATTAFSNTGITSGAKGTSVVTFKYQAASNFTWDTNAFKTGFQNIKPDSFFQSYYNFLTSQFQIKSGGSVEAGNWTIGPARTVTGNYLSIFSSFGGYDFVKLNGDLAWDSLADRWLTVICSYSSSSADFAGWTGGTVPSGRYASRIVLLDAQTGQQLSVTDWFYQAFQVYDTDWADYTWSWSEVNPAANGDGSFNTTTTAIELGYLDQSDILQGAYWMCQGQVIDPTAVVSSVPLSNYFVGQYFPETVNGVRAWSNWTPVATSTSGSNTLLTKQLGGRASNTNSVIFKATTSSLRTPITYSDKP